MNFNIINSIHDLGPLISDLASTDVVAIDTETSGLDWITCKLYTIQLYLNGNVYVVNCLAFKQLEYLIGLLSVKLLVGHNIKFDSKVLLRKTGITLPKVYDTMLAEVLILQGITLKKFFSLQELVEKYCEVTLDKETRKSFYEEGELFELTNEQLMYAARDVKYLLDIRDKQLPKLAEQKQLRVLDLEMSLIPVISKMEDTGVLVDLDKWKALNDQEVLKTVELENKIKEAVLDRLDLANRGMLLDVCDLLCIPVTTKKEREWFKTIRAEFNREAIKSRLNIGSTKQMLAILKFLGVKVDSTGEKVLKESKSDDPVVALLLQFREHNKKVTAFGETFMSKVHEVTGRIHAEFNQLMADTGRFSCSKPNLQQIVRDSGYRHCFIARPKHKIITVDYSQQELRLAGAITKEDNFINAFKNDVDLHTLTASILFDIPIEKVGKDSKERQTAKTFNFAVLYGTTEFGLAYNFQIKVDEAVKMLEKFYSGYPRLASFKSAVENEIYRRGYSSTPLGRKRFFNKTSFFSSSQERLREMASVKRQGFNQIIQGAGADITKLALVKIFEENPFGEKLNILMVVHDEIVCEVAEDIAEEAAQFIADCMIAVEQPFLGEIPAAVGKPSIEDFWSK
jgi:DNA polymerase I